MVVLSLFIALQLAQLGYDLVSGYHLALDRAGAATQRLADFVEQGIDRTLDTSDLVLKRTLDAIRRRDLRDLRDLPAASQLQPLLAEMAAPLPYVSFITIVDAQGRLVVSTIENHPDVNVADRPYFVAHAEKGEDLVIGPLIVSRAINRHVFTISRPIRRADGKFLGVAIVGIDATQFSGLVRTAEREPNGGVTVFKTDGVLLMREPLNEAAIGKSFADLELFTTQIPRSRAGTYEATSPFDSIPRILSYEVSQRWPVVVVTTAGKAEALAMWRANALNSVALVLVGIAAALAMAALVLRSMDKEGEAHQRTEASLDEKVMLLKEIHHRVKNNLQMVVAMLGLQGMRSGPEAMAMAEESIARIRSLSMVHELIYTTGQFTSLTAATYLDRLCKSLVDQTAEVEVEVEVEPPDMTISTEQAMFLAIMVNEVVTNAVKHAFPDRRRGRIRVSLLRTADGETVLEIADDGIGLPAGFKPGKSAGLGSSLMCTIARQLRGELEFANDNGTVVRLTMDLPHEPTACAGD